MPGINMDRTSVIGNVDGQQIHFARSTETIANTAAADTARLAANGGSYTDGDIVIASCSNGILIGKVGATGTIVA